MNKIYSDQIAKVNALVAGIDKNAGQLKVKGVVCDTKQLNEVKRNLQELAEKQVVAESELRRVRDAAHNQLSTLKQLYDIAKLPIKNNFPMEQWAAFGIPDKR